MAQTSIKAYWSEDYCNTDGFYLINYPDEVNYREVIIAAQSMLEEARDYTKEEFLESNTETLKMFNCSEEDYEYISEYYESHYNCSLLTVLDFICEKLDGWSYTNLNYDVYDLDYLQFTDGD